MLFPTFEMCVDFGRLSWTEILNELKVKVDKYMGLLHFWIQFNNMTTRILDFKLETDT